MRPDTLERSDRPRRAARQLGGSLRAAVVPAVRAPRPLRPPDRRAGCCCFPAGGRWRWPSTANGAAYPSLWFVLLFLVGAFVMRGAGCTYNDIVDRDIDAGVARTRDRPIPSGAGHASRPPPPSWSALCLIGLAVLLQFNWYTVVLGVVVAAAGGDLPVHEARHQLAAARARADVQMGRAGRLDGGARHPRMAGDPALCRLRRVDDRLRHPLCPPGQGGRPVASASGRRRSVSAIRPRRGSAASTPSRF